MTADEFAVVRRSLHANWPNLTIDDEVWQRRLAPHALDSVLAAIDSLPGRYLPGLAQLVDRLPARGPVVDIDRDALIARRKLERQADEDRHYAQQDAEHRERERAILKRQGNETYEQWEARVTAALTGHDDAIR